MGASASLTSSGQQQLNVKRNNSIASTVTGSYDSEDVPFYRFEIPLGVQETRRIASESWAAVVGGKTDKMMRLLVDEFFLEGTSEERNGSLLFTRVFFNKLGRHDPDNTFQFDSEEEAQKALIALIHLVITDDYECEEYRQNVVEIFAKKRIMKRQYGIIGEVLFSSLKHCLGRKVYTERLHRAWIRLYLHATQRLSNALELTAQAVFIEVSLTQPEIELTT